MSRRTHKESVWYKKVGRRWLTLDNAGKIFLATYNTIDTKVYRYTAVLEDKVDPVKLQKALDEAFDQFPIYRAVVRRGIFWYYLEESNLRPRVQEESQVPCGLLYTHDYRGLLFRVIYRENRIHLEIFHAISDGIGSLSFFRRILQLYLKDDLREKPILPVLDYKDLMTDAFTHRINYKRVGKLWQMGKRTLAKRKEKSLPVYHIKGTPTIDGRMRVIEIQCPVDQVISCARSYGTTVTVFLIGVFIQAIQDQVPSWQKKRNALISISVPVDLRNFFPSETVRNFFATTLVSYGSNEDPSLTAICQSLSKQFAEKIRPEKMEEKVGQLLALEESLALRWIPRPAKDLILKLANYLNNKSITGSMTNTGRLKLGSPFDERVRSAGIMSASVRPQFSLMSHGNVFTISLTSPFINDEIDRAFYRRLLEEGISLDLYGNRFYGESIKETSDLDYSPYPDIAASYNSIKASHWLMFFSVFFVALAGLVKIALPWFNLSMPFTILSIMGMWAVVAAILMKKRNPNKILLYQVVIFTGLTLMWDLLSGWTGWSITYALPSITITGIIGTLISARVSDLKIGDKLLYIQGVALTGFLPFIVMALGWTRAPGLSILALTFSIFVLAYTLIRHWEELKVELSKRFHI